MKTLDKLYSFFATTLVISLCFSITIGWIPILSRTWIFVLLLSFVSIIMYNKGLALGFIFPLAIYGIILYINAYSGDLKFNFVFSTMELFSFFLVSYMFYIYSKKSFFKHRRNFLICYSIVLVVTFLGTLFVYAKEPEVLRMIQTERNGGKNLLYVYYSKLGVESYDMGHALPCFIPILMFIIKNNTHLQYKLIGLVILCLMLALIYMSTATTALLLSTILLIVSFVWNTNNKALNICTLILCLCILIIFISNRDILENILNGINLGSESTYSSKLNDFREYATYGEAGDQMQGRLDLYEQSFNVFIKYPILGNDNIEIGGHSIFIDRLAMLGLVGFIPLIIYIYFYMRYVLRKISFNIRPYCFLGFSYFIIMAFLKNIFSTEYLIISLFIMPLVCIHIDSIYDKIIDKIR